MRYLYCDPTPAPSTWTCHTPDPSRRVMGCAEPSQPAHSPATCTSSALGAQTRNDVPSAPACAPSTVQSSSWRPSPMRWRSSSPGAWGSADGLAGGLVGVLAGVLRGVFVGLLVDSVM